MEKKYFKIVSDYDKLRLDVLVMAPDEGVTVKGIVQFSHGMCEHKERYEPLMEYLCGKGFVCSIHDHRGHGGSVKSDEDLGYTYGGGADAMVNDLHQVILFMKSQWKHAPVILIGHSMGSLVARAYLRKHDEEIQLLILSGSPSKNSARPMGTMIAHAQKLVRGGRHKSKLLETLSFAPYVKKFLADGSRFAWCCSDMNVIQEYDNNPLCGFTFTADGYLTLFGLMQQTYSNHGWQCKNRDLPILFMSGAEDPCLGNVRKFKQSLDHLRTQGYWNVKGKLYPELRHEIFNETGKEMIYQDLWQYIMKNLV